MRLTNFLEPFFPDENEDLWVWGLSPKEMPEPLKEVPLKLRTSRAALASDEKTQKRVTFANRTQGIYFTVNSGGTTRPEINRINAAFCEIDDLPIAAQHELYDYAPVPPAIRVETLKSVHAYWPLDGAGIDDWIEIQRGLIEHFKSDKALKNQNRTMRLPFFRHVRFEEGEYLYKRVEITTFSDRRVDADTMREAYPAPVITEPPPRPFSAHEATAWEEVFRELQTRMRALPSYHRENSRFASAQGICHNGESNRILVENLETGIVFCRAGCDYDAILSAFGIAKPVPKPRRYAIPKMTPPAQSSKLYEYLKQRKDEAGYL